MKTPTKKNLMFMIPILLLMDSFAYTIFCELISKANDFLNLLAMLIMTFVVYGNYKYFNFLLTFKNTKK